MYSCSKHGDVGLDTTIEVDEYGFAHGLSVCPECGRPTLLTVGPTIEEEECS
jgi:hypothetical protein